MLVNPSSIVADPTLVPNEPGIYGWWFDGAPPLVDLTGTVALGDRWLLYIGIAPSEPSDGGRASRRTLRDRLKNHTRGPIATSTLRRTLTALLGAELGLRTGRTSAGKAQLLDDGEHVLTSWLSLHARVAWSACPAPWLPEKELIISGPRLPLNIRDSADPFRVTLTRLRKLL